MAKPAMTLTAFPPLKWANKGKQWPMHVINPAVINSIASQKLLSKFKKIKTNKIHHIAREYGF